MIQSKYHVGDFIIQDKCSSKYDFGTLSKKKKGV